jgi:hypothetical protein
MIHDRGRFVFEEFKCKIIQVLTSRLGSPVMLALIYSELVKRLQQMGAISISVDMELPSNLVDLPHPRVAAQDGT